MIKLGIKNIESIFIKVSIRIKFKYFWEQKENKLRKLENVKRKKNEE